MTVTGKVQKFKMREQAIDELGLADSAAVAGPTCEVSGAEVGLALSVLAACAVEAVEALTIVLAVGATRAWRSALSGAGAALVVLAVITAALGPAVTALPIGVLRVVVGGLLLVFGLQWLRKAILRASGLKALHDEGRRSSPKRRRLGRRARWVTVWTPTRSRWRSRACCSRA